MRTLTLFVAALLCGCAGSGDDDDTGRTDTTDDTGSAEDTEPTAGTVTSDDGHVTLTVPEGALPDGVALTDLSITLVTGSSLTSTSGEVEHVASYLLEPSGLAFSAAATVRFDPGSDDVDGSIAAAHFSGSGELEILAPAEQSADLAWPIEHFSGLSFWKSRVRITECVALGPTNDIPVGLDVVVRCTVSMPSGSYSWEFEGPPSSVDFSPHAFYLSAETTYQLLVRFDMEGPVVANFPHNDAATPPEWVGSSAVTCMSSGDFSVEFVLAVNVVVLEVQAIESYKSFVFAQRGPSLVQGNCVASVESGTPCEHGWQCGAGHHCWEYPDGRRCKRDTVSETCTDDGDCTDRRGFNGARDSCLYNDLYDESFCTFCNEGTDCVSGLCFNGWCVGCNEGSDCPSGDCGPDKECLQCVEQEDCASITGKPYCDGDTNLCIECVSHDDCGGDTPKCGDDGACTECLTSDDCGGATPYCFDGTCEQCTIDDECTGPLAFCGTNHTCTECKVDTDCTTAGLPVCNSGRCGTCKANADCPSNGLSRCQDAMCEPCTKSWECAGSGYGCDSVTDTEFEVQDVCTSDCQGDGDCNAARGETCIGDLCLQCAVDDDCPDGHKNCVKNICYECRSDDDCEGDLRCQPVDFGETSPGRCVQCLADSDCSAAHPVCRAGRFDGICVGCTDPSECSAYAGTTCQPDGSCAP